MSWDVFLFNAGRKIVSIEEVEEDWLNPVDFCAVLENHFPIIVNNEDHRKIVGDGYSIDYFTDEAVSGNHVFTLTGEGSLPALAEVARLYGWQMYDTGSGEMIVL